MIENLSLQLVAILDDSMEKFRSITDEEWNSKPAPEKWSKKEILGHLADSAMNNIHRFVRVRQGDQTNIYYDQDYWVIANDYQFQDLESIQTLWRSLNLQISRVWRKTWDADLEKTIPVKDETHTLRFLMEDYIAHLNHHLRQII